MKQQTNLNDHPSEPVFDRSNLQDLLTVAGFVVTSYTLFINKESLGEQYVADSSLLPFPKRVILSSYKLWIVYKGNEEDLERARIQLPLLAQYQRGIGVNPLRLINFPSEPSKENVNSETVFLNDKSAVKLIGDIKLLQKIFEEKIKIEKTIHLAIEKAESEKLN